ncbi:thioredoxin/PDI [Cryptosporidium felis]|nr:thioredoxin/PDI [Cryptosporidium felis]
MNCFKTFSIPALLVCWSVCIVISILDIYYINHMDKKWSFYDNRLLESKAWWICGIPLSVYSLVIEISLLVATLFSFMKTEDEVELVDGEKYREFRSYNSSYAYSNLYENAEGYTYSLLAWIDRIGIWNRILFMLTNFVAIASCYYLFVGISEYNTKSVTFLLKSSIFGLALILTWLPGVLSTYSESFKLFGAVIGCSFVFILLMCLRNYNVTGKVRDLTMEIMNIKKLSKGEEIVNRRIVERYIESGGKYFTIENSPSAVATEMIWGSKAIQVLKDNGSYFDCSFEKKTSSWASCIEEKVSSYPSWVIGDKTISGVVSPKTVAHMVNINLRELTEEVLTLVHPDDKREIEHQISDFAQESKSDLEGEDTTGEEIMRNLDEDLATGKEGDQLSGGQEPVYENKQESEAQEDALEESDSLESEGTESKKSEVKKKRGSSLKKRKKGAHGRERRKADEQKKRSEREEEEERLVESMYEQPSLRGMSILNKLEASSTEENEAKVNLIEREEQSKEATGNSVGNLELPSKEEFDQFSSSISKMNEEIIKERRDTLERADDKIREIEEGKEQTEDLVRAESELKLEPERELGSLVPSKVESSGELGAQITGVEDLSLEEFREEKENIEESYGSGVIEEGFSREEEKASGPLEVSAVGLKEISSEEQSSQLLNQSPSSDVVVSEMIQSDEAIEEGGERSTEEN